MAAAVALLSASGHAQQGGPNDAAVWPYSSIGRVNVRFGPEMARVRYCTGTLIGARQVLTAAHCLYGPPWAKPDRVFFAAGYSRGAYTAHAKGVSYRKDPLYERRPQITRDMEARDWAILELDADIDLRPVSLGDFNGEVNVTHGGYRFDRPHALTIADPCPARLVAGVLESCAFVRGESGSALLHWEKGEPSIVGVVAAQARGVGWSVPTSAFMDAIRPERQ